MRIALFTHGIRGDVWPFIALCHHLRERDYDVTLAAPPNYAALVRAADVRYGPLPLDTEAFLASDEGRHLTAVGGASELLHAFVDDAFLEASEGAEALVAMHVTMEREQVIAEYRRLPLAMVWPIPLTPTGEFTSPVLEGRELPTRSLRRASHHLFHCVWAAGAARQTAALRRRLGLPGTRTPAFYRHRDPNALCLNTVSPSIVPRPSDWGPQERIIGSWRMPERVRGNLGARIPAALESWLEVWGACMSSSLLRCLTTSGRRAPPSARARLSTPAGRPTAARHRTQMVACTSSTAHWTTTGCSRAAGRPSTTAARGLRGRPRARVSQP